jgi:hypothetical protein
MELSAWKPHADAMWAYHRGNDAAVIVMYDDYGRDDVPVSYFFRDSAHFLMSQPRSSFAADECSTSERVRVAIRSSFRPGAST